MTAVVLIDARDREAAPRYLEHLELDFDPGSDERDFVAEFLEYRATADPYDPRKAPISY